jgi:hypothetical protein
MALVKTLAVRTNPIVLAYYPDLLSLSLEHALPIELAVIRWASGEAFGLEFIRMGPIHQKRLSLLVSYIENDAMLLAGLKTSV